MFFKFVIISLLLAVLVSLATSLAFLYKDPSSSTRIVKALTWRIVFSLLALALIVVGFFMGWITPHPLLP